MAQPEEIQPNMLDQLEENQHNTLAQQEENQTLADILGRFMPRPLAMFLDYFLWIISYVIDLCLILTFLHWNYGIEIDTRIYGIGVLGLWMYGILWCANLGCLVLKLISKAF